MWTTHLMLRVSDVALISATKPPIQRSQGSRTKNAWLILSWYCIAMLSHLRLCYVANGQAYTCIRDLYRILHLIRPLWDKHAV